MIALKPGDLVLMKDGGQAFVVPPGMRIISPASPASVLANVEKVHCTTLDIVIPDDAWRRAGDYNSETEGDEAARLVASISINGAEMYVEAFATIYTDAAGETIDPNSNDEDDDDWDGEVHIIDSETDEAVATIRGDGAGAPQTCEIQGREYVLVATPLST